MTIGSSAELRTFLLDQMIKTAQGKMEVAQAKAVCNLAQQVYNTVKLEMQFASLKHKDGMGAIESVQWGGQKQAPKLRRAA